jgi:carboxypeptidase Taq
MAAGQFGTLLGWLRENIYRHGAKFTGSEVLRRATGMDITTEPYLDYLRGKYRSLYGLNERELTAGGAASIRAVKPPVA